MRLCPRSSKNERNFSRISSAVTGGQSRPRAYGGRSVRSTARATLRPVSGLRAALLSLIILAVAAPAGQAATGSGYSLPLPVTAKAPPPGFRLSPAEAVAAADRSSSVQKERAKGRVRAKVSQLLGQTTWQVDYF